MSSKKGKRKAKTSSSSSSTSSSRASANINVGIGSSNTNTLLSPKEEKIANALRDAEKQGLPVSLGWGVVFDVRYFTLRCVTSLL